MKKNSKIICTIGPASNSKKIIKQMCNSGMNCVRINISHGDFNQYEKIISNVRSVCDLPIILDTQGPEVRVVKGKEFKKGDEISAELSVDVYNKLKKGIKVLIDDGINEGVITKVSKDSINIKMNNSGFFIDNKKIVFKKVNLNLPHLSKKDEKAINFAIKNKLDFIALSYASSKEGVLFVKNKLKNTGINVVSKIENSEGVKNFKKILSVSDVVMIARGDLGVEFPSEKIPLLQKLMIKDCNDKGVPVIVATQMMNSMIYNSNPTRAETSDVANAILDGSDSLMLSAETSIGNHPNLVVNKMSKICSNVENSERLSREHTNSNIVDLITTNAFEIANQTKSILICLTKSGYTARMLSRFKPKKQIIAITNDKMVSKQLMISYAIKPYYFNNLKEDNIKLITKLCIKEKLIKEKDLVVLVAGLYIKNTTNTIIVYKAKELLK